MRKLITLFIGLTFVFSSCSSNEDETAQPTRITINFENYWGNTKIEASSFNKFKFKNELQQIISIERLRYLVSNIELTDQFGNVKKLFDYNLVNVGDETGLSITKDITTFNGNQTLKFIFGFTDKDNKDGVYTDLNTVNFNVPPMLSGGYHYMQFDGKYKKGKDDASQPFNYHAIRAVKLDDKKKITKKTDTSFLVSLDKVVVKDNKATINVKVDISKWFSNKWDLDKWNTVLMPNYDAQIQMKKNGANVFSLLK